MELVIFTLTTVKRYIPPSFSPGGVRRSTALLLAGRRQQRRAWAHGAPSVKCAPAALWPCGFRSSSTLLTVRLGRGGGREGSAGGGSHWRALVQLVAVAGIRVSFQLLPEIPGIFFSGACSVVPPPPLLLLRVISALVAPSPGSALLLLHCYF